jgi:hypothetical protein
MDIGQISEQDKLTVEIALLEQWLGTGEINIDSLSAKLAKARTALKEIQEYTSPEEPLSTTTANEQPNKKVVEVTSFSQYPSTYVKDHKYIRVLSAPHRITHPLMHYRTMRCKKIEQITRTDHGTYRVLILRDSSLVEHLVLDCRTIFAIQPCMEEPGIMTFVFEEYFTDEKQAELHEEFIRDQYDDMGVCPEI